MTIKLLGGASTTAVGQAAAGGSVLIEGQSGSVLNIQGDALTVDTGFTAPSLTSYLGQNVLVVASNLAITPPASGTGLILVAGSPATGLHVLPGVTLTINPNGGTGPFAGLYFVNGVWNEGTIKAAQVTSFNDAVSVTVNGSEFLGALGSTIDASGYPGTAGVPAGGNGGGVAILTAGVMVNQGTILASGGSTAFLGAGGTGGSVRLNSNGYLYNTGAITANGNDTTGASQSGGAGGHVSLQSSTGGTFILGGAIPGDLAGTFNSGPVTANGGNGTAGAGLGGVIDLGSFIPSNGKLLNSGSLTANGGSSTTSGTGSKGGQIGCRAESGVLRCTGQFVALGGTAVGGSNAGGAGGDIRLLQFPAVNPDGSRPSVSGGLSASIQVDVSGGAGPNGGTGGSLTISQVNTPIVGPNYAFDLTTPGVNPLNLVGIASIDVSGGTAPVYPGGGGSIRAFNYPQIDQNTFQTIGPIQSGVPLIANGGSSTTPTGGAGTGGSIGIGQSSITFSNPSAITSPTVTLASTGSLSVSGGTGVLANGGGGSNGIGSYSGTTNAALLTADAGSSTAATVTTGFSGGTITLSSDTSIQNSGTLSANGGPALAATGTAGGGGTIHLIGSTGKDPLVLSGSTVNSGTISAVGGQAGQKGGIGGAVVLNDHFSTSNTGPVAVVGGPGGSSGQGGTGGTVTISSDSSVRNVANISAVGGTAVGGTGGNASFVQITSQNSTFHSGNITLSGGSGTNGGNGGEADFSVTVGGSSVHGTMTVSAGAASGGTAGLVGRVLLDGIDQALTGAGTLTLP